LNRLLVAVQFYFGCLKIFQKLEKAVFNDINADLINTYRIIASKPKELISILQILQNEYHNLDGKDEEKKEYYYKKRELYNTRKKNKADKPLCLFFSIALVLTDCTE
jgi:DNA adenine methylase